MPLPLTAPPEPWWVAQVRALLEELSAPEQLDIGALWNAATRFAFVHENVEPGLLALDVQARPGLQSLWSACLELEHRVQLLLDARRKEVEAEVRSGTLDADRFRAAWEALGARADDFLDGLMAVSHLTVGEERPPYGQVNMASKAARISDFLASAQPGVADVVYDLGSGNGKFALTVAASARTQVRGVEYGPSYVEAARRTGERLALRNAEFICSDVREVDLSAGTSFYLFHPFWGDVAKGVAQRLGALAQRKDIRVFVQGPAYGFGQYFLEEVSRGAFARVDAAGARPGPCGWTFRSARSAV